MCISFVSIVFKLVVMVDEGVEGVHGTVDTSSIVETQGIKYLRGRVTIALESAPIKGERRQSSRRRRRRLHSANSVSIINNPAEQDVGNMRPYIRYLYVCLQF